MSEPVSRPYRLDLDWDNQPEISPYRWPGAEVIRRPLFKVVAPMVYRETIGGKQRERTVPAGFISDGASIPLGLRWLIPPNAATWPPALWHDLAYCMRGWNVYERTQCDYVFGCGLTKQEIAPWRILAMYRAVDIGGGRAWREVDAVDRFNHELLKRTA